MPGAREVDWRGHPFFQVGSKAFALSWEDRTVLKLSKSHQELLFEARPDIFSPFRFGPSVWSYVEVDAIDAQELADLIREAWTQVVPKKVSRALTEG